MHTCNTCGSFVSQQFARIFGDNNDEVHVCLDCRTVEDDQAGEAPGL